MILFLKKIEVQIYTASLIACVLWFVADSGLYEKLTVLYINKWFPQHGWEPFIVFLAVITTITGITSVQGRRNWNTSLARKFLDEFPSKGYSVPFLKDHDMGAPFHNNSLKEIENFFWQTGTTQSINLSIKLQKTKRRNFIIN